ncbi:hypothetical protein ACWD25_42565, partial [Streptomyces sp. NPDC002920]
ARLADRTAPRPAGNRASSSAPKASGDPRAARVGAGGPPSGGGTPQAQTSEPTAPADSAPETQPHRPNPTALPWGAALLATGLAVEGYASRTAPTPAGGTVTLPTGLPTAPTAVLLGWILTALGLALAGPGLTHLCGRLLQAVRPGALRLLAGRGLMEEASRVGRPLGVVCAVASGAYTVAALYDTNDPSSGPLTTLGAVVVAGCTVATLLTAAVEARQARAGTTAALLRLGAPGRTLRTAAALRTGALLTLFVPLTLVVAELAALPLSR